jgi:hypothetical protein
LDRSEAYESEKADPGAVSMNNNLSARSVSPLLLSAPHSHASAHRVKNPLAHLSRDTLLAQVDEFAASAGLTDVAPLLRTGALVAQAPHEFESVEGLSEDDKVAIRRETTHRWSHPRTLYLTIILCSIGAAVQGPCLPHGVGGGAC